MKVLCVGFCTLDQIGVVERFAEPGSAAEMPTFSTQGGGTAATAAVALARWGVQVRFVGKVGDDERGRNIERTLSGEGVDTASMVFQSGKVSQTRFVLVESASQESITYFTPGNVEPLLAEELPLGLLDGQDLLVVDGTFPAAQLALMKEARRRSIPVLFDCIRVDGPSSEAISAADVVVTSERRASKLTGMGTLEGICDALLAMGPRTAVVTLGDEGAVGKAKDEILVTVDPYEVAVVDRTGDGDIFLGALALGVLEGWTVDKLLAVANCAAGLSCTGIGSRSEVPSREEIIALGTGQEKRP